MEKPDFLQLHFGFGIEPISKSDKKPVNEKQAKSDFVFDFMDCLTSPVIVFKSAWQDAIPKEVLKNVTLSRLLCSISGEKMASYAEVIAYVMPRTLEAPMPLEWVNIYTWVGLQYAKEYSNQNQISAMDEIAPKNLSDYELGLLNDLRKWIYDKRRKALKEKLKVSNKTKSKVIPSGQVNLFK